jgi:predicted permease
VHAVKAAVVRPAITATTAGAGNVPVSILEDVISTTLSVLSVVLPIVVGIVLLLLAIWIIWWLTRRTLRQPPSP